MRIIKFKAKDKDGIWWYGSLVKTDKYYIIDENGEHDNLDEDTISECTGESDIWHDLVYENDIVLFKTIGTSELYYGLVFYEDGSFCVEVCDEHGNKDKENNLTFYFHEIIINEVVSNLYH